MFSIFNQRFEVWSLSGAVCLLLNVNLGSIIREIYVETSETQLASSDVSFSLAYFTLVLPMALLRNSLPDEDS